MTRYKFDWVDAFTAQSFGGNGCAVVHDGAALSAETAMAFVQETSLVECTFTGPSDVADVRVRYFLASREIPFAGHPTIATAAALADRGLFAGKAMRFETGAGVVEVTRDGAGFAMTQIAPQFGDYVAPALVADVVSLSPDDIVAPPRIVSTGLPFCITVLRNHDALSRAALSLPALHRYAAALSLDGVDVMEPYLVTLNGATDQGDTYSRLLMAPPSPPEDPFTGSATGAAAAYLWSEGLMPKDSYIAEQGHGMNRPGRASVTRLGSNDAITGVRVSGEGFVLMRGEVDLT